MAINIVSNDSACPILDSLTKAVHHRCGAKTNLNKLVGRLSIYGPLSSNNYSGDTLMDFIGRVNTCEKTIMYGGAELGTNQFFEKVLNLLNKCPQTHQYVLQINREYSKHRKHNFGKVFQAKVIEYFTNHLKGADADFSMLLQNQCASVGI